MRRPNVLRTNGFGPFRHQVEARDGSLASLDERKALWIDGDGVATTGGVGTAEWFGRPRADTTTPAVYIDPVVLTEHLLEFLRFVYAVLLPRGPTGPWTFRVALRGLRTRATTVLLLDRDYPSRFARHDAMPASGDGEACEFRGCGDASRDAATALEWINGYFGQPLAANPFVEGR